MTFYDNYFNNWKECNLMIRLNVCVNIPPNGDVQLSPFVPVRWPSEAKAVEDSNGGIWGYDLERMTPNILQLMERIYTTYCFQDGILAIMDYDKDSCIRIPNDEELSNPPKKIAYGTYTNELIVTRANIVLLFHIKGCVEFDKIIRMVKSRTKMISSEYMEEKKRIQSRHRVASKLIQIIRWENHANEIQLANFLFNERQQKGIHGLEHSERVDGFGCSLAQETTEADRDVIRWFAYLHDYKRINNGYDINHGQRAAEYIDTIRETYLINLSDAQIESLKYACANHTIKHKTGDVTIDICFDADRLDLPRVGIKTNADKLATEIARKYSEIGYEELCKRFELLPKNPLNFILRNL